MKMKTLISKITKLNIFVQQQQTKTVTSSFHTPPSAGIYNDENSLFYFDDVFPSFLFFNRWNVETNVAATASDETV